MPTKTNKTDLTLFLGFPQSFCSPIGANELFRIILEGNAMDLPQIEMVSLKTT